MKQKYFGWHMFDYYQWLLEKIRGNMPPYYDYSLLLSELHSIPFEWSIDMDRNRAINGENLRWEYMDEENIADIYYRDGIRASVLEVLVALSLDCDISIMGNPDGDTAYRWFWTMIDNLDLSRCTDDNFNHEYVWQQIGIWLKRQFQRDGTGSPFPLKHSRTDQRKIEMWFQMTGYLNENYFGLDA